MDALSVVLTVVLGVYSVLVWIQIILGYGTAYRLTKTHGDSGVSLFGWTICCVLAAYVPVLGIYLWHRYRHAGEAQARA